MDTIFISCSGLGMGNASRVSAIVEALSELAGHEHRKISFHIVSWGAGYRFLERYQKESPVDFELSEITAYPSWIHVFGMLSVYIRNIFSLLKTVRRLKPRLVILDSDYHFPAFFRSGCPIVYVGQAHDVVKRAQMTRPFARLRERMNFFIGEKLDAFLQNCFSHMVLVPCFSGITRPSGKIFRIPLIVRREFLDFDGVIRPGQDVGVLLSGSNLEKEIFHNLASQYNLSLLTHLPSRASSLDRFDVIITQGGLSSISECVARSKFLVVFPMRGHSEQILNAREVENLGLGMSSTIEELNQFPNLIEKMKRVRNRLKRSAVPCNGADVAARLILDQMKRPG